MQATEKLAVIPSIEYFITHWKYGVNGENTTVLLDPGMRVIAFFDRGTADIEVIKSDLEYRGSYVLECLSDKQGRVKIIKHKADTIPKYEPIYYMKEMEAVMEEVNKLDSEKDAERISQIKGKVSEYVNDENINYFKKLLKNIN